MTAKAEQAPPKGKFPKRRIRNYLLDPRFQLKYAGLVCLVTLLLGAGLGYVAYRYSRGMTETLTAQQMIEAMDPATVQFIQEQSRAEDRKVAFSIVGGVLLLVLALGVTGIVITHRIAGPAYKLRLLFKRVEDGTLVIRGGLRRGDELQEVGEAFKSMIDAMRDQRLEHVAALDEAIAALDEDETEAHEKLTALRAAMHEAVQDA